MTKRRELEQLIPVTSNGNLFRNLRGREYRYIFALPVPPVAVAVNSRSPAARDITALDEAVQRWVGRHSVEVPAEANAYFRGKAIREEKRVYYPISFYKI